ncbi:MAG: PilW family protein [Betaproteobacteria bacterium]
MKKTNGFSLVEIMVGMLVGLIGTMVIFQVFAVAEGQKRTTTSGGDASQSAAFALFSLERELRISGQGFNNKGLIGCSIRVYDDDSPPPKSRLQGMVPAVITPGLGNAPDTLSISYVSSDVVNPPAALQASVTGNGTITVDSRGFTQVGDVLVMSNLENGQVKLVAGVPHQCTMFRVTSIPAGSNQLGHAPVPGTYTDAAGSPRPISLNHSGGLDNGLSPAGLTFPAGVLDDGGYVYNLGKSLTAATYFIANNRLMRRDDMGSATPIEIADGIVQMKVLYGIDANADSQIATSEWTKISPTTPLGWQGLRGVKLALVARSALKEKADPVTGICNTTTTQPQWYGAGPTGGDIALDVSADTDWRCYRYKVLQTVVPVRNMAWAPYR